MKIKEQINIAQDLIKRLQDYIELKKVKSKLNNEVKQQQIDDLINDIVFVTREMVKEL